MKLVACSSLFNIFIVDWYIFIGDWVSLSPLFTPYKIILSFFLMCCELKFDSNYNSLSNCYRISQCYIFSFYLGFLITFWVLNYQDFIKLNWFLFPSLILFLYFKYYWEKYDIATDCFIIHISKHHSSVEHVNIWKFLNQFFIYNCLWFYVQCMFLFITIYSEDEV